MTMRNARWTPIAALGLYAAALLVVPVAAYADTAGCVSRVEYENTVTGLSPVQVYNRYDTFGYFMDDTSYSFRRGYRTCWAPEMRRAIVVYSYDTNSSIDWYVRDI